MSTWHGRKGRKKTGGLIRLGRKKRLSELGSLPVMTRIGAEKKKTVRTKGGSYKVKTFSTEFANVLDRNTNQIKRVKILDIVSNPANSDFVRMKVITKGAIIKTELGNARVLSMQSWNLMPSHGMLGYFQRACVMGPAPVLAHFCQFLLPVGKSAYSALE
jgi:small subunit ribosomal protein S8e